MRKGAIGALQFLLEFDFHVHTGRQIELHQRIDSFVGRVNNVHQALVGTDLKLVDAAFGPVFRYFDVFDSI